MINVAGWSLRAPSNLTRLIFFVALSLLLMTLDHRGQHLGRIRAVLGVAVYPIQFVAALPSAAASWVSGLFTTRNDLEKNNAALAAERQLLLARLQQFEALEAENERLRRMLGSAARVADKAVAADLLEVSSEPFARKVIVAKGSNDGVFVGQPVIDAHGVMGQVTEVAGARTSKVTLITDPGHAIPALVNRSGLRVLVFGTGAHDRLKVAHDMLKVPYLTATADIKEGDLLMSSGMGGTFPAGYPVGQVVKVVTDPNESFLDITVKPAALLSHSKQVLLIWPGAAAKNAPPAAGARPAEAKQ
ncbi:MAG: rod shape-determining protein MreC [Candidatus Muproteobacteria bacterium RIFCSPHIGHO2_01_FULL_65_16]|uniref:Cell shape-determining protein MreC n=1 Tax=Candidatus Muproteobacteria bacterium RIFCSPHIGHO2_01_FULL_65_16 TaxID=1817764 RepID=A0A1F6TP43_9PROT|nr:MAG: rod shape-determining protein MreC [Candidatus Muproteobacteria bacterium RIFCSPHIGHO2_01_FULL_65_16]